MDPAQLVRPCSVTPINSDPVLVVSEVLYHSTGPVSGLTSPPSYQLCAETERRKVPPKPWRERKFLVPGCNFSFAPVSGKVGPPGHIKGGNSVLDSLNDLLLDEVRLSVQLPATLEAGRPGRRCLGSGESLEVHHPPGITVL